MQVSGGEGREQGEGGELGGRGELNDREEEGRRVEGEGAGIWGGEEAGVQHGGGEGAGGGAGAHLAVLLVVADEVAQLLLAALQCGVQLLHLAHQVRLLALQALPVGLHGCGAEE